MRNWRQNGISEGKTRCWALYRVALCTASIRKRLGTRESVLYKRCTYNAHVVKTIPENRRCSPCLAIGFQRFGAIPKRYTYNNHTATTIIFLGGCSCMHHNIRSNNLQDLSFDPDIEGTARKNRRNRRRVMDKGALDKNLILAVAQGGQERQNKQNEQIMEDERVIRDYVKPRVDQNISPIQLPMINANNFEIKSHVFQMLAMIGQFGGKPTNDPNAYLRNFDQIFSTFKINGASKNVIQLRIFPFLLKDRAKA
ncbi:hypothetical protein Q3G72_006443 [Acer saccharum]|nr:hypothetical protein Q3G72_006443 [Acer saccharum]